MGLTDSKEGVGLSSHTLPLPQVCLLLSDQALCLQLQAALGEYPLAVSVYATEAALFAAQPLAQIDCLVLLSHGDAWAPRGGAEPQGITSQDVTAQDVDTSPEMDGVRLLERFQAAAQYVPTVMIVTDPRVAHAVRAMRALAVECFDHHTPIPLLARSIRDVALKVAAERRSVDATPCE